MSGIDNLTLAAEIQLKLIRLKIKDPNAEMSCHGCEYLTERGTCRSNPGEACPDSGEREPRDPCEGCPMMGFDGYCYNDDTCCCPDGFGS